MERSGSGRLGPRITRISRISRKRRRGTPALDCYGKIIVAIKAVYNSLMIIVPGPTTM